MASIDIAPAIAPAGAGGPSGVAVPFEPLPSFSGEAPESDTEAASSPDENAQFWRKQIETALVFERRFRGEALAAEKAYFGPDEDQGEASSSSIESNNMITEMTSTVHANIEVLKPLIFSQTPQPIVQRRFRGDGKATDETDIMAAEAGQRLAQYLLATTPFDAAMEGVRDDWLIAGRGVGRVLYKAQFGQKPVINPMTGQPMVGPDGQPMTETVKLSEEVCARRCEWRRVLFCPSHSWEQMPWIGLEVPMTRSQIAKRFPDHAKDFSYNRKGLSTSRGINDEDRDGRGVTADMPSTGEPVASPFDNATVWEIWNKETRQVIWWSPDCGRVILDKVDDPLQLEDFWPMPKPLLATTKGESMLPRPDIRYYEERAKEVEIATRKMRDILKVMAVAGLFPGSQADVVKKLMDGKNALYAVSDWIALMEKGGTNNIIQWLPIQAMVEALNALNMMREASKQAMFEASGVSDIMRAQGDPNETATAQNLKGKYAGMRLSSRQRRMAIFVRDMLRLMVEIAVEHFDTAFIAEVCGLDLPMTEAERQQMEQQAQQAEDQYNQQAQQHYMATVQRNEQEDHGMGPQPPVPPMAPFQDPHIPGTSWEKVHERLKSDITRKISVQIETASTILADEQEDKQARIEFMGAFSTMIQELTPLMASGQFPIKTVKEILLFGVRGFPNARTLEGMISELPDEMPNAPQQEEPSVAAARIRTQGMIEVQKLKGQADLQLADQNNQNELKLATIKGGLDTIHKAAQIGAATMHKGADVAMHDATLQHQAEQGQAARDAAPPPAAGGTNG